MKKFLRSECASSMTLTNHITPASLPDHLMAERWVIVQLERKKKARLTLLCKRTYWLLNLQCGFSLCRDSATAKSCTCRFVWGVAFANRNGAWSGRLSCFLFRSPFQSFSPRSFLWYTLCCSFVCSFLGEERNVLVHHFFHTRALLANNKVTKTWYEIHPTSAKTAKEHFSQWQMNTLTKLGHCYPFFYQQKEATTFSCSTILIDRSGGWMIGPGESNRSTP